MTHDDSQLLQLNILPDLCYSFSNQYKKLLLGADEMKRTKKVGLNALLLAVTLAVNALGAFGFINGTSQSDVSDQYFTLITPSGMTFSIWSVIYGLLILSLIMMYIKRNDIYYQRAIDKITPLFLISCLLNIAWIVLFSFVLVELSTLFIFGYTILLTLICRQLLKINDGKHLLLPLTFGLYTGWLMIATVVNVASSLVKINWGGFGLADTTWAMIILILAALLVLFVSLNIKNAALPLPIAWAYYGIYQNLTNVHPGSLFLLRMLTIAGIVFLIGLAAIQFYRNHYMVLPNRETV